MAGDQLWIPVTKLFSRTVHVDIQFVSPVPSKSDPKQICLILSKFWPLIMSQQQCQYLLQTAKKKWNLRMRENSVFFQHNP